MRARKDAVERLLAAYRRYYTITRFDGVREAPGEGLREAKELTAPFLPEGASLSAVCEYYERAERYFILHSNELWSTHQEEFVFVFSVPHLSKKVFDACRDYAYQAGMDMAHIGSGHMYTYISPVFLCDTVDEEARIALEKCILTNPSGCSLTAWLWFQQGGLCF